MLHYDVYACNKADWMDIIGSMDGSYPMAFVGRYQSLDEANNRAFKIDDGLLAGVVDIVGLDVPDEPEDDDDFEF